MPAVEELCSLRDGVYSATRDGVRYLLTCRGAGQAIGPSTDGQRALLARLAAGPATVAELAEVAGGPVAESLARWRAGGWLDLTLRSGDRPGYTVRPFRRPPPPPERPRPEALVLSRFAVVRREEPGLLIESPRAWCDIQLHDPVLLSTVLGGPPSRDPAAADDPTARGAPAGDALADRLAHHLWWAGMLVPPEAERQVLATRAWYPHELWFHHRSRNGDRQSTGDGYGGTFWLRDEFDPPPAEPPPLPGPTVALPRPDLAQLRADDPPLAAVVEDRRSVRTYDEAAPLSVAQLGELLFRCARSSVTSGVDGLTQERRPVSAAGSTTGRCRTRRARRCGPHRTRTCGPSPCATTCSGSGWCRPWSRIRLWSGCWRSGSTRAAPMARTAPATGSSAHHPGSRSGCCGRTRCCATCWTSPRAPDPAPGPPCGY